jgi:thiol:disulfide interchange protein DsbC
MFRKSLITVMALATLSCGAAEDVAKPELKDVENNLKATNTMFSNASVIVYRELSSENMPGLYEASIDGQSLVVTADGKKAIVGEVFDLKTMANLTRAERQKGQVLLAKQEIAKLQEDDFVTYPAVGESIGQLYIFSDTTCGYCRKLHLEVEDYQNAGIDVKYIPYPRSQLVEGELAFEQMKQVMCADDKLEAMTKIKAGQDNNQYVKASYGEACVESVRKGQEAGRNIGLQGTPFMYLSEGKNQIVPGYQASSFVINMFER